MDTNPQNERRMLAYLFERDKFDTSSYGDAAFEFLLKGGELKNNPYKVVVSYGDIVQVERNGDISPFIIRDGLCTISKTRVSDFPWVFLLEDIVEKTAQDMDARLKKECPPYLGMTSVDLESQDAKKRFWQLLSRGFSVEENVITSFSPNGEHFWSTEIAEQYGFQVTYDGFVVDYNFLRGSDTDLYSSRQSSFITKGKQLGETFLV